MNNLLKCKVRVTVGTGRYIVGRFMGYDKFMNVIIFDGEEHRFIPHKVKKKKRQHFVRSLGLIIIRGDSVISMTVEGQPPKSTKTLKSLSSEKEGPSTSGTSTGTDHVPLPPAGANS